MMGWARAENWGGRVDQISTQVTPVHLLSRFSPRVRWRPPALKLAEAPVPGEVVTGLNPIPTFLKLEAPLGFEGAFRAW